MNSMNLSLRPRPLVGLLIIFASTFSGLFFAAYLFTLIIEPIFLGWPIDRIALAPSLVALGSLMRAVLELLFTFSLVYLCSLFEGKMLQMRALVGLGLITGLIFNILSFFAINFYSFLSTIPVVGSMMELGLIIPAYYFFPHGIASLISVAGYVAYLRMAREKENDR